ncbi:ABC transporter permease [Schaedlerella sp.]|jgi:ribose/xylose/arabinose/galactoside ABC-type transport system permease subunit|uniref:ABC transporter permease n=1 Tax=Schaedlerella sp. TaxID=2676057 RepID=UPI003746A70A|nr:ABC transporter permease [Ruminococcus sp.]
MADKGMAVMKTKGKAGETVTKYFLLIADVLLIIIFGIMRPGFLQMSNLLDIVATASLVGTMGMGASIVMMVGEMNFGVGAEATLTAAMLGWILGKEYVPVYVLAVLIVLLLIGLVGVVDSYFGVILGVPAFIATLAISKINDGFVNLLTENRTMFYNNWPPQFKWIGQGKIGPIPVSAVVFAVIAFLLWFMMDKTRLGAYIQAVGNNQTCCRQVGINVRKIKIIAFIICSLVCGFAGIMAASKTSNVMSTLGSGIMMDAMASAMLGATFLRPGRYNIQGTVVAALLTAIISNGITFCGYPDYIQNIVNGIILLIAVGYIAMTRKEGLPSVKMG